MSLATGLELLGISLLRTVKIPIFRLSTDRQAKATDHALPGKCKIADPIRRVSSWFCTGSLQRFRLTFPAAHRPTGSESSGTSSLQADLKPALIAFTPLFCMKNNQTPTKNLHAGSIAKSRAMRMSQPKHRPGWSGGSAKPTS
jgi:hypothetical protein